MDLQMIPYTKNRQPSQEDWRFELLAEILLEAGFSDIPPLVE